MPTTEISSRLTFVWITRFAAVLLSLSAGCRTVSRIPQDDTATSYYRSDYVAGTVRPGLRVTVMVAVANSEEFRVENRRISDDGLLTLPLIGAVPVNGMTLPEMDEDLQQRYAAYLINPEVTSDFVISSGDKVSPWGHVTVLGRVRSPGRIPMPPTRDLTVVQAIQAAGGLDSSARQRSVRVIRTPQAAGDSRRRFKVNLRRISGRAGSAADPTLRAGDVVYVPESWL